MRANITETRQMEGSIVFGHRRETRHAFSLLVVVKGVEQSAAQRRLEPALQTRQLERVSRRELNLDPAVVDLLSGDRRCRLSPLPADHRNTDAV